MFQSITDMVIAIVGMRAKQVETGFSHLNNIYIFQETYISNIANQSIVIFVHVLSVLILADVPFHFPLCVYA